MQPVTDKPVLKAHHVDHATLSDTHGRFSLGSYPSPSSPKIYELRARYEAQHPAESDSKSQNFASFMQRVK